MSNNKGMTMADIRLRKQQLKDDLDVLEDNFEERIRSARTNILKSVNLYEPIKHLYPYASPAFKAKFDWLLRQARANKCHMVVRNFTDRVRLSAWSGSGAKRADEIAEQVGLDRKSTRLNASHVAISYAVFCLQK